MEFWTTKVYSIRFLISVAVVVVRSALGGDKGEGLVLSCGYFEYSCYGKLEVVRPVEGDPLVVL